MKTITTEELKSLKSDKSGLIVVNTLDAEFFENTRIPGAINIPLNTRDFASRVERQAGGRNQPVVVYCASQHCGSSEKAAQKLDEAGFTAVLRYTGGAAWQKAAEEMHAK